jgi:hypothetical protein
MDYYRKDFHRKVYLAGLALLGISLPVSLFAMSVSELLLAANWAAEVIIDAAEGDYRKLQIFKQRKSLLLIFSIYLVHIIGLLYSHDFKYAFHDLRIKLPFLALPIIIGTSEQLTGKQIKYILLLFIGTVIVSSFISTAILLNLTKIEVNDIREISRFISHIRFALLINMAIFTLVYYAFFDTSTSDFRWKIFYILATLWLIVFLFLLQSFTGILIFIIISPFIILRWIIDQKNIIAKTTVLLCLLTGIFLEVYYITSCINKFYSIKEINNGDIDNYTVNGNKYDHNFNNKLLENGNYVNIYICEKELESEWNKRSEIYKYDGKDKKGQNIKQTLIRYLTSKGLRKDSVGVSKLTDEDIAMILDGYSNYIFKRKFGIYPRIYQIIWEIDTYKKLGNPSGHSITQRYEFQKNAFQIIKKNFWLGVGTGDVKQASNNQYKISNSSLAQKWRLKAHNQLITFFLTFGVFGFLWIMFALIYPVFYEKKHKSMLFVVFFMIAFFSMLNEDTLETHAGISFFSYFYALLLLGYKNE